MALLLSTKSQHRATVPAVAMAPKRFKKSQAKSDMAPPRFLIVSLGNPAPYLDTLHSAGHLALKALQERLSYENPPFTSTGGRGAGLSSVGSRYALVQSPAMMNVSGLAVQTAWKRVAAPNAQESQILVLVHDDLESKLGEVKLRKWDASGKGHNGVKSTQKIFSGFPKDQTKRWARITIGIGRPDSRDQKSVSDYVLKKMGGRERSAIQSAADGILDKLVDLEEELDGEAVSEDAEGRQAEEVAKKTKRNGS
jgi:peptidyl-tRNA hydrolase, PTH1 family